MCSSATTEPQSTEVIGRLPATDLGAPHLFTTRLGGVSGGPFSAANLGDHVGDDAAHVDENRRRAAGAFGTTERAVRWAKQVHGRTVWNVDTPHGHEAGAAVEADALVSATPGTVLAVVTADCVPLLLFDPGTRAVAAVHAGWRGAGAGVVCATLDVLGHDFGVDPVRLRAVVGPSIEGRCYQVGSDVVEALGSMPGADAAIRADPDERDRWRVDVATVVIASLVRRGVHPRSITRVGGCTACRADLYYSHRRDGPRTGRQGAFVQVPSPRPTPTTSPARW